MYVCVCMCVCIWLYNNFHLQLSSFALVSDLKVKPAAGQGEHHSAIVTADVVYGLVVVWVRQQQVFSLLIEVHYLGKYTFKQFHWFMFCWPSYCLNVTWTFSNVSCNQWYKVRFCVLSSRTSDLIGNIHSFSMANVTTVKAKSPKCTFPLGVFSCSFFYSLCLGNKSLFSVHVCVCTQLQVWSGVVTFSTIWEIKSFHSNNSTHHM